MTLTRRSIIRDDTSGKLRGGLYIGSFGGFIQTTIVNSTVSGNASDLQEGGAVIASGINLIHALISRNSEPAPFGRLIDVP